MKKLQLLIDGDIQTFIPLRQFKAEYDLPHNFSMLLFAPQVHTGLGWLRTAEDQLGLIQTALLEAIPLAMPLQEWVSYLPTITDLFENKLHEFNAEIGLKSCEIEQVIGGFDALMRRLLYAMIRAQAEQHPQPTFNDVYQSWLNESVSIANDTYHYTHQDQTWAIQIIRSIYGDTGLIIWMPAQTYYIDCLNAPQHPTNFVYTLLAEVAEHIMDSVNTQTAPQ